MNHIKKTFTRGNNISEALRTLEDPNSNKWEPTLIMSAETNNDLKTRENCQYKLDHKAEYDGYLKRKREYEQNSYKQGVLLTNMLMSRCSFAHQIHS